MPRRKGETDQQWMERLHRYRDRDDLFEAVHGAKTYVAAIHNPERAAQVELCAFMAIFHPEKEPMTINDAKRALESR